MKRKLLLTVCIHLAALCLCSPPRKAQAILLHERWTQTGIGEDPSDVYEYEVTGVVLYGSGTRTVSFSGFTDNGAPTENISIPSTVTLDDGMYTVTGIGGQAVYHNVNVKTITIPDTIEWIGTSSFAGCTNATGFTMGSNVQSIGEQAFYVQTIEQRLEQFSGKGGQEDE